MKSKIQEDIKDAMRAKDELKLSVLRMLSATIHNKEIEKRVHPVRNQTPLASAVPLQAEQISNGARTGKEEELNEEEVIAAIRSEVKKRRDSIAEFDKGGRKDLVEKESAELKILEKYLPQEISDEEIEKIVKEVVAEIGVSDPKMFGRIMGGAMKKIKGQASGDRVSSAVRKVLGN